MNANVRIFEYKRGPEYACQVTVNEFAGALVFTKITVPNNTPQTVKAKFLEEAELATLREVERTSGYNGY